MIDGQLKSLLRAGCEGSPSNPSTWEAETGGSLEFQASLIYHRNSGPARVRPCFRRKNKVKST